eukprot:scaffold24850_cov84-Isochrysis_galbana.AAC.1
MGVGTPPAPTAAAPAAAAELAAALAARAAGRTPTGARATYRLDQSQLSRAPSSPHAPLPSAPEGIPAGARASGVQ